MATINLNDKQQLTQQKSSKSSILYIVHQDKQGNLHELWYWYKITCNLLFHPDWSVQEFLGNNAF